MKKVLNTCNYTLLKDWIHRKVLRRFFKGLKYLSVILSLVIIIRVFVLEFYYIPSESMENTLKRGDVVLVSKLNYGARLPIDPFEIPFVELLSYLCGLHSELDKIEWASYKVPGFFDIQKNDIIVFKHPKNSKSIFIKRCVAKPGDIIAIERSDVYVNGKLVDNLGSIQYLYKIELDNNKSRLFHNKGIAASYNREEKRWTALLSYNNLDQIKDSLNLFERVEEESCNLKIFPYDSGFNWNRDNFGPLLIPQKGFEIELTEKNILLYGGLISKFEDVDILFKEDLKEDTLTFQNDYYFMLGDNRHCSNDSRYWGCLPEKNIVGKAIIVCWSIDPANRKLRWKRSFKRLF